VTGLAAARRIGVSLPRFATDALLSLVGEERQICTCRPFQSRRLQRRFRPRRLFPRRAAGRWDYYCYRLWPGGITPVAKGTPISDPNLIRLRTIPAFEETVIGPTGRAEVIRHAEAAGTNPFCYPPAASAILDIGNDGTYRGARRAATLGHKDPDAIAGAIGGILSAYDRGTVTREGAGRLIAAFTEPPLAASQAALRLEPLTEEQRAARRRERETRADPAAALAKREAEQACKFRTDYEYYCADASEPWPTEPGPVGAAPTRGGAHRPAENWLGLPAGSAHPGRPWHGPTAFGVYPAPCIILPNRRERRLTAARVFQPPLAEATRITRPVTQGAPLPRIGIGAPSLIPPPEARTPGDGPDNCIVIERLFSRECAQGPDGKWYVIRGIA